MAAIVGRAAPSTAASGVVERDPELDLDLPAGDAYMVDDEAHELLAFCTREVHFATYFPPACWLERSPWTAASTRPDGRQGHGAPLLRKERLRGANLD